MFPFHPGNLIESYVILNGLRWATRPLVTLISPLSEGRLKEG